MSDNALIAALVGMFFLTISILIVANAWCGGCFA